MNTNLRYFDEKQANILLEWKKKAVQIDGWEGWCKDHSDARNEIKRLFRKAHFFEGGDLNENQIGELFEYLQWGQGGRRSLNRKLYEANWLKKFNSALRELLDEDKPLPERVKNFLRLKGVGIWTMSQFLSKWLPEVHPFVATTLSRTGFMDIVIFNNLIPEQIKLAKEYAVRKFGKILDDETLKYLTYSMVLYEIQNILQLNSFLEVQNVLWRASVDKKEIPRVKKRLLITPKSPTTLKFPDPKTVKPIYIKNEIKPPQPYQEDKSKEEGKSVKKKPVKTESEVEEHKKETGKQGELIVFEDEKRKLIEAKRSDLAKKVNHISLEDDSAGYDILSFRKDGSEKYIEVKSTKMHFNGESTEFEITATEVDASKMYGDDYYIYRVFDVASKKPQIKTIKNLYKKIKQGKIKLEPKIYNAIIYFE